MTTLEALVLVVGGWHTEEQKAAIDDASAHLRPVRRDIQLKHELHELAIRSSDLQSELEKIAANNAELPCPHFSKEGKCVYCKGYRCNLQPCLPKYQYRFNDLQAF